LEALARAVADSFATGDLHVARVAYEAMGRLIDMPQRDAAEVTDLQVVRATKRKR
jgi:hypothetical protein